MKYRRLPVIAELTALSQTSPSEAEALRHRLIRETLATPGFQLVVAALQEIEAGVVDALRAGVRPDFQLGRLGALNQVRNALCAMSAEPLPPMEAEEEEAYLPEYESGFIVKPHTADNQVPPADLPPLPEEPV